MSRPSPFTLFVGIFLSITQFHQQGLSQESISSQLGEKIDQAYPLVNSTPDSAIKIASEVYAIANLKNLPKTKANALYIKGLAYWYQGKAEFALVAHAQALKIREDIRDFVGIGRSLNNIGLIAQHAGSDSLALSFFTRSFDIRKQAGQDVEMIYSATNIFDQLDRMGQHDAARTLREKVMGWAKNSHSSTALAFVAEHAGLMEEKQGSYQLAQAYYQQAYDLREGKPHQLERTRGLLQLSRCMAVLNSNSLSTPILQVSSALDVAIENNWKDLESQAYLQLSQLYDSQGSLSSAYQHLVKHKNLQDKISEGESLLRTQALTAIYSDLLKRENLRKEEELKRNSFLQQWVEWLIASLLITLILGIGLYVRYVSIKSQRNRLDLEKKQMEEKNLKLKTFSSVVSHDIKEPLRSFTYFLELLNRHGIVGQGSELEEEYNEAKNRISDLSFMLKDLEIYFGLTEGIMKWRELDLQELTNKIFSDLKHKINRTKAQISVNSLPAIETQPTLFYQIVLNLVSNALRFQHPGEVPVVEIKGRLNQHSFSLSVKDNGIGIPPEQIDGIFKAFNRGSHHQYPGSGLGLAIVAKAVALLEGTIEVKSEVNHGSIFTVTIPIASHRKVEDLEVSNPQPVSA